MKSHLMFGFLTLILLFGHAYPAMGQSSQLADHVVINEVDINPPGDDSKSLSEWAELYNPTDQSMDVGGWTISAISGLKTTYKIPEGTKIKSDGFLVYSFGPLWFPDVSATVVLKTKNGTVIDQTPILRDIGNDLNSWQRSADGLDTDSASDWVFKISNAGSSNGKISSTITQEGLDVKVFTDKTNYVSGDIVKITGQVSKRVDVPTQKYVPAQVNLIVSGPSNFWKAFTLYPDTTGLFKTEMKTDRALNVPEGDFQISTEYGGAISETQFSIGQQTIAPQEKEGVPIILISTDKSEYIPGEWATISATTSKIIPFAGLQFKVFDPNKKQVYDGTLYPDPQGKFSVKIFINTVKPVFGKYDIVATYDTEIAQTYYEMAQVIKEDRPISLKTDKQVYGVGDTVIITGRSNKVWLTALDIDIVQAFATKLGERDKERLNTLVIKDIVRLAGDSTFKYELKIPKEADRYGDYKVKVSGYIGTAELTFKVVENPDEFVAVDSKPLSISTDKPFYNVGDSYIISGKVTESKDYGRQTVKIALTKSDGSKVISAGDPRAPAAKSQDTPLSFTGVPDASGNFVIKGTIHRQIFDKGTYILKATYGALSASTSFEVRDEVDPGGVLKITASTDKEIYGVGEEVKLTATVSTFNIQSSYQLTLTNPDGNKVTTTSLQVKDGQLSWAWTVPSRGVTFGTYKIVISSDYVGTNLFFKVSKDPASEVALPLVIETDKLVYNTGETITVSGNAIRKVDQTEFENRRAEIVIKTEANKEISKAFVDLNPNGQFKTTFKLAPLTYKAGEYKVTAKYYNAKAQAVFQVDDKFSSDRDAPLLLLVNIDKFKYLPGETVKITGKTNKITSAFSVDVSVAAPNDKQAKVTAVTFDSKGAFSYNYKISETATLGTYIVVADTDFDRVTDTFEVVSELPPEEEPVGEPLPDITTTTPSIEPTKEPTIISTKTVDRVNRITDSFIPISIGQKTIEGKALNPRILDGLLRVNAGDESSVNVKVTLDGTCLIGQDSNCKITKSTRSPDSLYEIIKIDDTNFKVRYSGPAAKLEKFTILPEDPNETIPDGDWNVQIVKDNQISRFYYKISYISQE
ncbi:MAG: lamin tail domain-containing protein [Nitrosopumilaceae archaeon]